MPTTSPSYVEGVREDDRQKSDRYKVLYDEQCEICQAGVSWLRLLDKSRYAECIPLAPGSTTVDSVLTIDDCLRELHVIGPDGVVYVGWDAVCRLARLCSSTALVGIVGQLFPFRLLGRAAYRFLARNRYALSRCRGGACSTARPQAVRREAQLAAFWSCYSLGFLLRLPLVFWSGVSGAVERVKTFIRTRGKRFELLDGKLSILILNGFFPNVVPILFGELFTAVIYDGIAIDPGSPKMRRSLSAHLASSGSTILGVVATHAHEEHVGNLNWMSKATNAPLYVSQMTAKFLSPCHKLPWVRRIIIGQPPNLEQPFLLLSETLNARGTELQVLEAPGHCDDHVVLYDPKEKVLLAGDAFMGSYFSTPNPDVDSRKWLVSLERLLQLDIEILVEGHGHIHTLRGDVPDIPGVVFRQDPKVALREKLEYLRWLSHQIETGIEEGLPVSAIEATCFPWTRRLSWETCANDQCIKLLSLGHFSRTELVRSFVRQETNVLPTVYEVRLHGRDD